MKKIPLSKVFLNDEIRDAAMTALNSGRYILADECAAFEQELADFVGMKHCVLSSSWTAAVFLLHKAQGLGPGDEVILPSHTAFPSVEPLIHQGATPIFVDVDDTYCLDPAAVEAAITPRTVGIIPVHLYGHPADMDRIQAIADKHKLWVLEDCAQAIGARYRGKRVGSMGTASAFSFYPSKNLTVFGDGGCVLTNDAQVADKVRMLRNHGRQSKFTHDVPGFNLRFNEIQAAIRYNERLADLVQTPPEKDWAESVYHMYVIQTKDRDALGAYLKEKGIGTGIHYPVANHQQPAITDNFSVPVLPRTEALVNNILSLPVYGEMPLEDADAVADQIAAFLGDAQYASA
ncbi:MAG: DegT/DnrJ/EryC1/StrS family aminotransferase [Gammaproteobacteria bacterium]